MKKFYHLTFMVFWIWTFQAQYDTTFNQTGLVLPPYIGNVGGNYASAQNASVRQLPDGRVLTFGTQSQAMPHVLRRYLPDGSVDTTFGTNGVAEIPVDYPTANFTMSSVSNVMSNGKILIVAHLKANYTTAAIVEIKRLNSNGSLDTTFGTNGVKTISDLPYVNWSLPNIIIFPSGRIYFMADERYQVESNYYFVPVIFSTTPQFEFDTSFGENGVFLPDELGMQSFTNTSNLYYFTDDGGLLINISGGDGKHLIKMTSNGQVDMTFGTNGIKTTDKLIYSLIPVAGGKFWGSGPQQLYNSPNWFITRYNSDLTIDTSFGTDGSVPGALGKSIVQTDGKIVTLRGTATGGFYTSYGTYLTRYNIDGAVDLDYQLTFSNNASKRSHDIAQQSDGKILVCGSYKYPEALYPYQTAPWLARFLPELSFLGVGAILISKAQIYPNPIKDVFTVSYALQGEQTVSIAVHDLQGRLVESVCKNELQSGNVQREIRLQNKLANGIFFLKVETSSGISQTAKLIKQ